MDGGELAYLTPEAKARVEIDRRLAGAGWTVQDASRVNLRAAPGVAVREFVMKPPHGRADYLLFFDRKPASETPWTRELWVYDLRTNQHFTLKQNPLKSEHLADFVAAYAAREESERFRRFAYDELLARDKVSLDLIWLRDESLEDLENLPPPDVIAQEIVEDLEAAVAELAALAESLARRQDRGRPVYDSGAPE